MTDADLAAIHAAAMVLPRPWSPVELGALRLMPGLIEVLRPDGFALGRVAADEAELLTLAVRPAAQGRGLGTELLDGFHAAARAAGATTAFLEVAEINAPARALYARAGYAAIGRRPGYYTDRRPAVDALVLSRPL